MKVTVKQCQRCGHDHVGLRFRHLSNAVDEFNLWAICPLTGQPVLMQSDDELENGSKIEYPVKY